MSNIEFFIFVLLVVLFLFDLYVLCWIYDFGWNICQIKLRRDPIGYIQNEIIKTLKKDLQSDDLNNGAKADDWRKH